MTHTGPPSLGRESSRYGATTLAPAAHGHDLPPPRQNTWVGTSWLMLTDIVGTSVLTFTGVAQQLGWVTTIIFIVGLQPIAIYTAILMCRTQQMVSQKLGKEPLTMGEAARLTLGGDTAASLVYFAVYGYAFLGQASYILVLAQCMQGIFSGTGMCKPVASVWGCLFCLPFVVSIRSLHDSVKLCFVNLFLILAVLGIVMGGLFAEGQPADVQTHFFAPDLNLLTAFGAATNVVFSYAGHWLYFELMAEMSEPAEFPNVFLINAPLQVVLNLTVACWGYYFRGDSGQPYFLDNLPDGPLYRVASIILLLHVLVVYLLKNVVLTRFLHQKISPQRVNLKIMEPDGWRAQLEHASIAIGQLVVGCLLANALPFFNDFMGLVGGFCSGPISFVFPIAFFIGATYLSSENRNLENPQESMSVEHSANPDCRITGAVPPVQPVSIDSPTGEIEKKGQWPFSRIEMSLFTFVTVFTLMTMVVGTIQISIDISANIHKYGPPFSCQARTAR